VFYSLLTLPQDSIDLNILPYLLILLVFMHRGFSTLVELPFEHSIP